MNAHDKMEEHNISDVSLPQTTNNPTSNISNHGDKTDDVTETLLEMPQNGDTCSGNEAAGNEVPEVKVEMPKKKKRSSAVKSESCESVRYVQTRGIIPLYATNIVSYVTAHWFTPFAVEVYKEGEVLEKNVWSTHEKDSLKMNGERFEKLWKEEVSARGKDGARLGRVIWKFAKTRALIALFTNMVALAFGILVPTLCMRGILTYTQAPDDALWYGLLLVLLLFVCEVLHRMFFTAAWVLAYHYSLHINAALFDLMYGKLLRMHSLRDKTPGKLINIFMTDLGRIYEAGMSFPSIPAGPITAIVAVVYCAVYLGPWALIGALVIIGYYPYQYSLGRKNVSFRRNVVIISDKRIRKMTEILTNIKLIKLYCWEKSFAKIIEALRNQEFRVLQRVGMVQTLSTAVGPLVPVLAGVFIFVAHTLSGNNLDSAQPFVVLGVLFLVRPKLAMTPVIVKSYSDSVVALKRLQSILVMKETIPLSSFPLPPNQDTAIEITNGTFACEQSEREPSNQITGNKNRMSNGKNAKRKFSTGTKPEEKEKENLVSWRKEPELVKVLFDIELNVSKGKLIGICGSVGCGKSSLLSAILAQIEKISGLVCVRGSVAYVPQQAWILNATLRENITFGLPFEKERYNRVLKQCCLLPDIAVLPAGDKTEIGERGINLSGGQKQRVSLARAVYSNHDNYLLDDPLSAVDAHVGHKLFENVHKGALKDKTVLFVTHQLQYLSQCDYVLHMKAGRIAEEGTHDELLAGNTEYATLIATYYQELEEQEKVDASQNDSINDHHAEAESFTEIDLTDNVVNKALSVHSLVSSDGDISMAEDQVHVAATEPNNEKTKKKGQLIDKEEIDKGAVTWKTYKAYARAGGGYVCYVLVLGTFLVPVGLAAFTNWWLSYWITQGPGNANVTNGNETMAVTTLSDNPDFYYYVIVYCALAVALVISLCLRGFVYIRTALKASRNLHNQVFSKVLESPMSFYDTTPLGRTLNRFSKDQDVVDMALPQRSEIFFNNICTVLVAAAMVAAIFPWILLALVPLIVIFCFGLKFYRVVLREIKRSENVTRSPVSSILTTTLQGLNMVHAYNKQEDFRNRFREACDRHQMMLWLFSSSSRWLTLRLDLVTVVLTVITALLIVCTKGQVSTAMAGLALVYSVMLTGLTQFTLRVASETETLFTSVERIRFYSESVMSEAARVIPDNRPASNWPVVGAITFHKYSLRYRPGLPLVLKDIACDIKAREKIGIVGRTGAGKSSLGAALFRLVEPASGSIEIDGVDICTIGLEDLRSKLSIIPQDPALFSGTLRFNLDPFDQHSDADVWQALSRCHVKDKVTSLPNGLSAPVDENGKNFSVGERQLICMARALLRNSKILILDEATAAIDTETDSKIQTTKKKKVPTATLR